MGKTLRAFALVFAGIPLACSAGAGVDDSTGQGSSQIVGGTPATAYPEAAYLDIDMTPNGGWACSAVLIAPKVILTAGHCVDGHSTWDVHVGAQERFSRNATTYDWHENGATSVDPTHHDIGLVFVDQAIALAQYPAIARAPLADGSKVVDVGRMNNGVLTTSLYAAESTVTDGAAIGYPFDYESIDLIQHGDSGGPDFASGTHTIVSVNSGAGAGLEVLARVDLLADWIAQQIAAHGGPTGGADAGAADASAADASAAKDASAAPTCAGPTESEPNDAWTSATTLAAGPLCASLASPADEDWYAVSFGPGPVSIALTGAGDALLSVGVASGSSCTPSITGLRQIGMTSPTARKLCIRVASPTRAAQPYTIQRQ